MGQEATGNGERITTEYKAYITTKAVFYCENGECCSGDYGSSMHHNTFDTFIEAQRWILDTACTYGAKEYSITKIVEEEYDERDIQIISEINIYNRNYDNRKQVRDALNIQEEVKRLRREADELEKRIGGA